MGPEDRVEKDCAAPSDGNKAPEQHQTKPKTPVGMAVRRYQKPEGQYDSAHREPKHWWKYMEPFVAIIGVLLLALYSGYTVKLFYQNRQQFTNDERPWVWINFEHAYSRTFEKDSVVRFNLPIKNFGKSPAIKIDAYLEMKGDFFWYSTVAARADIAFGQMLRNRTWSRHNLFVLPAGAILNYPLTLRVTRPMLAEQSLSNILQFGEAPGSWTITGRITYIDSTGKLYTSDVCSYNLGMLPSDTEPEMAACPDHNEMN